MERYRYFNNIYDYHNYLSSIKLRKLGSGSEGEAFLTRDNKVVKIFGGVLKPKISESDKEEIIMAQDYNLESFCFPEQLQIVDGLIVSYINRFFPNNVLKFSAPYNGKISDIDIDNLLKAYHKMVKDTKVLFKDSIMIYDLAFNLLFNNKSLAAIDTFNYYRDSIPTIDDNLEILDYALLHELHFHDINFEPDYDKSMEYNLKRIKK